MLILSPEKRSFSCCKATERKAKMFTKLFFLQNRYIEQHIAFKLKLFFQIS